MRIPYGFTLINSGGLETNKSEAVLAPGAHSRFGSGKNSQFKPER